MGSPRPWVSLHLYTTSSSSSNKLLGKTGAAVGTQVFLPIENNLGIRWTFIIAAFAGVAGILVTYFFVPNLSGQDLAIEDEKFRAYLVRNGWHGMMGEDDLKGLADEDGPSTGYGRARGSGES